MAKIGLQALAQVRSVFKNYETEVKKSKLQPNSQWTYLLHARNFVRWIEGDFTPGGTL